MEDNGISNFWGKKVIRVIFFLFTISIFAHNISSPTHAFKLDNLESSSSGTHDSESEDPLAFESIEHECDGELFVIWSLLNPPQENFIKLIMAHSYFDESELNGYFESIYRPPAIS